MAPSVLSKQEAEGRIAPSVLPKQEEQGPMAPSVLSNQEEQGRTTPSILSKQEGEGCMAPSILSDKERQCHVAPYKLSHKQVQGRMAPYIFSHKQLQGRMAPFIFSQKQVQGRMAPSILSNKEEHDNMAPLVLSNQEVQPHIAPSILSHKEGHDRMASSILSNKEEHDNMAPLVLSHQKGQPHMAPSILSHKEGHDRMAHSILSHLERQARRPAPETPRSRAKSGKTTLARSSSSGGKQTGIKRVSFYGLDQRSTSKDDGLTPRSNADIQRMNLSTLTPLCRQMCLVKKRTVTTSNLTVHSPLRQAPGNLNMHLTNTTQLNVTDSSNVRRNNEQESSRSRVRRPPEKGLSKQSQPNSRSKVRLAGIYWEMSKPGACRVRSRQPPQKVANVYGKPAGKLELNKTLKNIQKVEKSPESQSGNNSLVARTHADGLEQKKSISRRKAKLPISTCNSKRTHKRDISNKIRELSELSAFAGNDSPLNHTEDFREYIQLTRSDLHPFDAQRIRKDGSPVDPAVSKKRTILENNRVVNKTTGYSVETTPAINSPATEAHSSLKSRFSHKGGKLKKQRSTRTLDNRQKTGNVREKSSHIVENLSKESEDRLNAASQQHKHVTDDMSGLTAAKQLQYKLVLGNLQAFRELPHPKTVDPPKTTNLESRLQRIINIVRSSTASPPLSSSVALSMQRSVPHKMASPNLNDETSKRADVETLAAVTAKQTAHSGDFCSADEYPNVAAQRRNAAYMAYANTGRRAELLGDVIEVVAYKKHSSIPRTGDAKSGFSKNVSAHKLKSLTAKNSAEIDSKNKLKPKLRKLGRLKRRCSKSAVTARSKRHDRVINTTDNSSTKQVSTKTTSISERHARMNKVAMQGSTRQQSKKPRKPRCGISRSPRQRRRCKPRPGRHRAPAASDKSRSYDASSHRRARPSKSKYGKTPSTNLGRISRNVKHSDPHTAKCEIIDKKRMTDQRSDASNNKCQTMIFMFKRCHCLNKSQKAKRPRRKRFKPQRYERCRCTNNQTDYFNRNNQRKNIKKDLYRLNLPETKPCQAEGQLRGGNQVESTVKRHLSPNMYLNTAANGEDDSDHSGGLSGTPCIRTINDSRPSLLTESNSLFKQWENLLITEDR